MLIDFERVRIFIKPGTTDMRKQISGLSVIAESNMKQDVFSANLFLFCGKSRRILKAVYWDRNGFCLWLKRLERERFPWPVSLEDCREITGAELRMLLSGIDFFRAHQELQCKSVS